MKQYVIVKAYGVNYYVLQYVDNKLETRDILPEYMLEEYVASVESKGYTRGYYVPEYEKRMLQLKNDYEFALQEFKKAEENPLSLSEAEEKRFKQITFRKQFNHD